MSTSALEVTTTTTGTVRGRPQDPRTRGQRRTPVATDPRTTGRSTGAWARAASCSPADRASPALTRHRHPAGTTRLTWTPRGVAVMVCLVLAVVAVMTVTVVVSFLGVSNEPQQSAATTPIAVSQTG